MSAPLLRHGWQIAFQPQLFARQYAELKSDVTLLAAVMAGIKEHIAADPYAARFCLSGPLRRYGRLKGLGLPDRYRLFFRPFQSEERKLLLILWLGHLRRDGDRNDCYAVFSRMVQRGDLPDTWASLEEQLSNTEL
jgi:toxin YhaV